jgi:hypothetical protein
MNHQTDNKHMGKWGKLIDRPRCIDMGCEFIVLRNVATVYFVAYVIFISTFLSNLLMYMASLLTK